MFSRDKMDFGADCAYKFREDKEAYIGLDSRLST